MKKLVLALTAATSLTTAALHAQTIQNGSFENPALTGSTASGSGLNWGTTGTATVYTNGAGFGTTPYGVQWEGLGGTGATDAQTISSVFTLNRSYTLTVAVADVSGNTGDQFTIAISGGATASQTFSIPTRPGGFGSSALTFATYSLAFTPTTNTAVTVTFTAVNTAAPGETIAVDNVNLVPEPSTWALLGIGAGVLAIGLRRRTRRA